MKVLIRIPKRTVHELHGRRSVAKVLRELGMNPESVIVIKGEDLMTMDQMVEDEDEIEVRPAISGGATGPSPEPALAARCSNSRRSLQ